ncbi:MAG: hypothetical protein FWG82_05095, partial [Oscillospiraceae bacterium]|nr:hypothetical protein [Oscillospiraceae bacterium]
MFLRILHKSRLPAKRMLSCVLSLLMLLSAATVAVPLLKIPAKAAPYNQTVDGIKEALDNGDEVRALQLFYEYNKDDERFSGVESQRQKGSITPNSTADNVQVRDQISPPYTDWNAGASLNLLQREMGLTGDYQFLNDSNMTITNPTLGISPADATIVTMNLDAPAAIGSLGGSWGGTPGRWNPANPWVAGTFDGPAPYGRRPTTYNSNSGWSNNPGDPYCLYLYGITGEHEYAWGPQPGNLAVHDVARFALRPARGQNSGTEPNSANSRDNPAADPLVAKTRNLFTALKEYDSIDDIPYVDSSAPATSLIPLKTEVRFTYYMSHSDKAVADQSTGDDGYWFAFFWNYLTGMDAPINSELRATKRVVDALNNAKNDPLFGDNATPAYIAAAFGLNESNLPATDSMSGSYSAAYDTFRYNTANSMLRSSTIDGVETLAEAYDIFDHFFAKEVIHGEDTPDPSDDVTRHRNIILKGVDAHRIAMQLNSNADPNGGSARGENYYGNPNEFLGNSKFPFGIMNAEGVKEFYNEGEYFTQEQAEALSLAIRGSLNAQSGSGKYENIMTYGSQPYVDDASTLAAMLGLRNFGYEAALGMMVWQGIDPHDEHFILDSVDPSSPWWFWTGLSDWYVNNSFSNYGRLHSYPYAAEPGGVSYLDHIVEQANSANVMPRYKEMSIEAFVVWVKNIQMVIDVWLTAALVFDPIMEFVEQQWMNPPNYHKGVSVDMTQDSDGNWIYDDLSGTYWNTGVFVHGMDPWQFIDLYNVGGLDPEEFEDELKMALQAIYQNRDDDNMPFSTIQIMNLVSIARNYNTMLDFFDDESVLKGLLGEFDVYEYDSFGDPVLDGSGDPVVLDTLDYYEEFKKIWNALTDEYSYRGELFFKLTDGLVGGVIEELVVTGKTGRMGYEPAWYAERNWFEGNMPPMPGRVLQLQSGLTVNELASLFRQYTHRYEAYELEAQRVKDEMSKFEMPDHWWSEIYEVQTPRQVSDDSTRSPSSLVMSNDWGEIVARTYRDDFGYALAKRLQNSVNAAMNEFRSVYYNTVGDANLEYDETTGELKNTFMNYMFARRILGRLDRTVIQHFTDEEALLYVNNLNVHNLVNITAVNPNHMPNFYDRNIYSAATSDEGRFDGKILTDSRTVLGDYYYIIAVMSAAIAAFEADPQWDHIQHYTNGDAFTGEYITRFGKGYEANVYDYRNDIARTTGEDYTVTGNTIQSLVDSLDGFASNADVGALLSALDLDLSSLGVSSAADLTLDNIIKTALGNMLYSNDTINMIVELVYGMVLPIFEDVFAEFSSTEMPDMLAPWSTLHIYSLHELLSNRDKVFGTTRQNQYTIAN